MLRQYETLQRQLMDIAYNSTDRRGRTMSQAASVYGWQPDDILGGYGWASDHSLRYRPYMARRAGPYQITRKRMRSLRGHIFDVVLGIWHPTMNVLATASGDSHARMWFLDKPPSDENSCKVLPHWAGGYITSLDWSHDGNHIATTSTFGWLEIFDIAGEQITGVRHVADHVYVARFNEQKLCATAAADGTVVVWNLDGSERIRFTPHTQVITSLLWIGNDTLVTGSFDHTIAVCKLDEPQPVKKYLRTGEVNEIKYNKTYNRFASCSHDNTVMLWSLDESEALRTFEGHTEPVMRVEWNPIKSIIASCSEDGSVRFFDVETGKCLINHEEDREPLRTISYSPDGKYLAYGCGMSGDVNILDSATGELVAYYCGDKEDDVVLHVKFSRCGNKLSVTTRFGHVFVLDVRNLPSPQRWRNP